jgi:hypothetical protein
VSEHLEITAADGSVRRVAMVGDTMTLGSGAAADVQCGGPGVDAQHLRFVRTTRGVRVEPCRAGGLVAVNGEPLFCKDLAAGDVIALGDLELRWLAARAPAPRPPSGRTGAGTGARAKAGATRRPRAGRAPAWLVVGVLVGVALLGGALLLRTLARSSWPHTPQHYVDLAREQVGNGQPQRALDTLEFALRDATGPTLAQAQALQADIRRLLVERAGMPQIQAARQEHDLLAAFAARYLGAAVERPAARELVRLCDEWTRRHADACRGRTDGEPLLRAVEQLRAQHATAAALGEPDTAADVIFAARSRLRFQWRDYRGAIARLDAFLAVGADAEVAAERARMLVDGEQWLQGKLRQVDLLLARGDRANAALDLQQLERWSALPEWAPLLQERRARL